MQLAFNARARLGAVAHALGIALVLATMPRVSAAQTTPAFQPPLRGVIEDAQKAWNVPGIAIAVVNRDGIVAAEGFGVRALGRPEPVDPHTLFDIASLTKSFTSAVAAMLVDEGKIRWDDTVRRFLPTLHFPTAQLDHDVTLRDLLSHRVGINPTSNWLFRFLDEDDTPDGLLRVRYLQTQAPFRTTLVYSNIGYLVVGEALASASGIPWADLVRTRLIEPLGMRESFVNGDLPAHGNVARPHAVLGGVQRPIRSASAEQGGPAAGVRSTAYDMATWLRFHLSHGEFNGKRIISAASLEQTHSPQIIIPTTAAMRAARGVRFFAAYGMGWQVMDYRGHPLLWHSGNADGMPSYMAILPDDGIGVVVLLNSWIAATLHGALANRILDEYLGVDPREYWTAGLRPAAASTAGTAAPMTDAMRAATPAHALVAYVGAYAHPLYGPVTVRDTNGTLSLQLGHGQMAELVPIGADSMSVRWVDPLFRESFSTVATFSDARTGKMGTVRMVLARDSIVARRQ